MRVLIIVLYVIAAVSFGLAAANVPARINWIGLGLFAFILTLLIPALT